MPLAFFMLLFVFSSAVAIADDVVSISLKPYAVQRESALKLAALAEVSGPQARVALLGGMLVPARGRVGDTIIYSRDELQKNIAAKYPHIMGKIRISGAHRIVVKREGVMLSASRYVDAARSVLMRELGTEDAVVDAVLKGSYVDIPVPAGDIRLGGRVQGGDMSRRQVSIDVAVDGEFYRSIPVAFDVSVRRQAWVITRPMAARTAIAPDAVEIRLADVSDISGELVSDPMQFENMRSRHSLHEGAILRLADMERKPEIALGQAVDVMAQVGGVVVQTKAIAERDGFLGDRLRAKLAANEESLWVEVIGEGRAIVSNAKTF